MLYQKLDCTMVVKLCMSNFVYYHPDYQFICLWGKSTKLYVAMTGDYLKKEGVTCLAKNLTTIHQEISFTFI